MASSVSKLIPSDPEKVMVIRHLTPQIMTCSTPFLRFGRIKIGGRGTVVSLASGNLAVFSPVALTPTLKKELSGFGNGEVHYITALDQEHHIFIEQWHKEWPEAKVIAPETLPAYREKQKYGRVPEENWILFKKNRPETWTVSAEFDAEFDTEYISAHGNQEVVFNHKPSKTLIEADLLFNLPATEQFSKSGVSPTTGIWTRIFNYFQHTQGEALGQKRFLWYLISANDRKGFNESIARINRWDFQRLIPCHGDVIEEDGKGIFGKVMAWHLNGKK
jgi:hypothetical protein